MTAAIYARKSTEQRGDAESKSVARQLADARAFAHRMHFPAIGDQHVYTDDAVSGADVKNLRARARLIADVDAGKIDTIIMADMSRFSRRDGAEVLIELKQIARKATIWFYETGQPYNPGDDLGSRAGNFIQAESNRDYRLKIRVKTIAALKRKAALGHVVTRPCYGYKNVPVFNGTDANGIPSRTHTIREVDLEQAKIVSTIFETFASGRGLKHIANLLNSRGVPTPTPKPGRIAGWDTSNIRAILKNPIYSGIARWNRLKQHDEDGPARATINPDDEHVIAVNEQWRIVSAELSDAVDRRFAENKANGVGFGKKSSRGGLAQPKHLLTGKLQCAVCGGTFTGAKVAQRPGSKATPKYIYECAVHRRKGDAVCSNTLRVPVETLDTGVLRLIAAQMTPAFVDHIMRLSDGGDADQGRQRLEAERDALTAAINRLLALAEAGAGDVAELAAKLKARTAERETLNRRIALLPASTSRSDLRAVLEQRVADWKTRLLSEFRDEARVVLDQLLQSRSIVLFNGTAADFETADVVGLFDDDDRGKEGIEPEDCFGLEISMDLTRLTPCVLVLPET
jgi:site-specific DNA recombinase